MFRTSYRDCCTINHLHTGECFFPNGTKIVATSLDLGAYYITRHEQKIQLYFQNTTNINGMYYCTLPDLQGHNQAFYFSLKSGELLPVIHHMRTIMIMICMHLLIPAERSIQSDNTPQIEYNPLTSTLRCKFKGDAHDVLWYFATFQFHFRLDGASLLAMGNQYHQSVIQMTNEENYYINELTVIDRSASFGPYKCTVCTDSCEHSAWLSIGKKSFSS